MFKSLIQQPAHPQAASGQGQEQKGLSELLKHAATLQEIVARPPQQGTVAAQRSLLLQNLAPCVKLAGQPVVSQRLAEAAPVLLAALHGYRWLHEGQKSEATRLPQENVSAVVQCESSLLFALRQALQQVLGAMEQHKARAQDAAPLPAAPGDDGATVLGRKLADLGHLADAISQASHHIQAFTAANAAGHLVDKTLQQWASDAPALAGLYSYRPKVGADFDRLDTADLPRTKHLPPMGFAIQPNLADRAKRKASPSGGGASSKQMQVVGGRAYELQHTLSDRTGMTGKVRLARAHEAPEQKWIAKVQSTHAKLIGAQKVQSHDLADILQRSDQAALAEAHLSSGLLRARPLSLQSAAEEVMQLDQGRVQVTDHFIDEFGKYYQIMPAMAGDLTDFAHAMGALVSSHPELQETVTLACLIVTQQLFAQVAAMHARKLQVMGGMAHRDIKLNNIVFHENGLVRLIDFDEAKALSLRGRNKGPANNAGTISSPERYLPGLLPSNTGSAKASDVWNAGVTALAMLSERAGAPVGGPLMRSDYQTPHGRITVEAFFLTYQAWWHMRIQGGPKVLGRLASLSAQQEHELTQVVRAQLQKLQQAEGRVYPIAFGASVNEIRALAFIAEELTTFANGHLQLQPRTATLLFRHALAPVPKARSSASAIDRGLSQELSQATPQQQQRARDLFARAAGSTPLSD